jgi:hypothetical protein
MARNEKPEAREKANEIQTSALKTLKKVKAELEKYIDEPCHWGHVGSLADADHKLRYLLAQLQNDGDAMDAIANENINW